MTQRLSYIAIGAGITLLVILGTIMIALRTVRADESTIIKQSELHITNSPITNENNDSDSSSQLATANSHSLAERTILIENWAKSLTKNPGWLHTVVAYDFEEETHGTLPNSITIPGDYVLDNWKLLNEQGQVVSMINIMKDMNGSIIQFATYKDGYWSSFADGEKWAGDSPIPPWQSLKDSLPQSPDLIECDIIEQDDRITAVFSIFETYSPIPLEETNGELVKGHILRETFDQKTGQPVTVETIFILEDGSDYLFSKYEFQLVETVKTLPDNINQLLLQEIDHE